MIPNMLELRMSALALFKMQEVLEGTWVTMSLILCPADAVELCTSAK